MRRIRKTYHNYWEFEQQTQENYLNVRYQFGYLDAGYYLRSVKMMNDLTPLFYNLALSSLVFEIIIKGFKEAFKNGK